MKTSSEQSPTEKARLEAKTKAKSEAEAEA